MKLESIKLYSYKLPLLKKLYLHGNEISEREGFILELISDTDLTAFSEIAPLPYFSQESLTDV